MDEEDASGSSSPGGNLFDYYENVSDKAELSKRTSKTGILNGQAAFFTLITKLGLPVLDKSSNQSGGQDHLFVGLGASYRVSRALFALSGRHSNTINIVKGEAGKLEAALKKRRFVTKRIVPKSPSTTTDGQQLAAIANEIRILANKTLKESNMLVKLLCVAWDEIPALGRHWPRLLLEAADYGNIENVLVFQAASEDKPMLGVTYKAKICDFGFSVITTDYLEDDMFSEQLGTEPWSSPELTFGTEIMIKDLPKSDIYSLGLLSSRIFMNGGNPFGSLTREQIRALKCQEGDNSLLLHNIITDAIFSHVTYTKSQNALIQKQLLTTLGFSPEHRFPLHLLAAELILLGHAFKDDEEPLDGVGSINGKATSPDVASPGDGRVTDAIASTPISIKTVIHDTLGYRFSVFSTPFKLLRRAFEWATIWFLRSAGKNLGLFRNPWEDFPKPKEIYIEPIAPLPSISPCGEADNEVEQTNLGDMPDFEDTSKYSLTALSASTATEIVQDLLEIASRSERPGSMREAEAAYQLGIAYFEGIKFPKDPKKGLQWLENAALGGSKKALASSPNIYASVDCSMSSELSIACDTALPNLAKHGVHLSSTLVFDGRIARYDDFAAVRRWMETAPQSFNEYLSSSEYGLMRVALFSIHIIKYGVQQAGHPFDFSLIEGYKPFTYEKSNAADKSRFIKSVRQHSCLQSVDISCMTLLQRAAARGDLELTKTLVLDLSASVDACGTTPGLTPLWISCFHGYVHIAAFLYQQCAMPTCRDSISGRTILHFLNQFGTAEDIAKILEIAFEAGFGLEEQDNDGNTPLMSTFIGWDFSKGIAANFLLELGANVLVKSKGNWTPMCAAVNSLDVETSRAVSGRYRASILRPVGRLEIPATSIEDDKVAAFGNLGTQTQFYWRRVGGEETSEKLQLIVDLLLDEGMVNAFRRSDIGRGSNPLIAMSYMARDDLVLAVLNSLHCPGLEEVDETNGMSALHWSVERSRVISTTKLLLLKTDPLLQDKEGLNAFHRAARFSPSLLLQILEYIDSGELPRPADHDTKSLIAMATTEGYTAFAFAVTEGSTEHLKVAETLRTKYHLDHDSYSIKKNGTKTMQTLMAYLVHCSITSNLFTLEQIEYVLNIDPQPNFIGDTLGDTLLHYAVSGWQYADISSNHIGYAVLRLLLRKFPGREHLDTANARGYTPIHHAVYHANIIALEIIKDHLDSLGQEIDPNFAGCGVPPPLHGLGQIRKHLLLKEEDEPYLHAILKKNTAKTYAFMRNQGGCLVSEREGAVVCIFYHVQNELSKKRLLRFLEASRTACGVQWEFIEADVPSAAAGTEEAAFLVELCWAFDHFVMRARPMLTEKASSYVDERAKARFRITKGEKEFPWTETKHDEDVLGFSIQWTRLGRAWTLEELQELTKTIENAWLAMSRTSLAMPI